jgi:hypothetical protein
MPQIAAPNPAEHGSGVPVSELRADARDLSTEDFEDRHGNAFLMLTAAELRSPGGPAMTVVNLEDDEDACDNTAGLSLLAYPVRRTERSAGHLITFGRTANNDVVIPDISISRFHAFAKEVASGRLVIQDAGSTNGSMVNSDSVPSQGHGPPSELKAGDRVRLGQVEFSYLDANALLDFLRAYEA